MNGHFSVVNKRGLITSGILLAASIILFSLSLSKKLAVGSIIWTISLVVCIIIFIMAIIIMTSVLTAGIDVKNGIVIFADATGQGGKQPQFNLGQLDRIELRNAYLLFSSFFYFLLTRNCIYYKYITQFLCHMSAAYLARDLQCIISVKK